MEEEIKYIKGKKTGYTSDEVLVAYLPFSAFDCEFMVDPMSAEKFEKGWIHRGGPKIIFNSRSKSFAVTKDDIISIRIPPCNSNNLEIKTIDGNTYLIITGTNLK